MNAFPFQAKRSWSLEIGKGEKNPKWGDLKSNSCLWADTEGSWHWASEGKEAKMEVD